MKITFKTDTIKSRKQLAEFFLDMENFVNTWTWKSLEIEVETKAIIKEK